MTKLGNGGITSRIADALRGVVHRPHVVARGERTVRVIGHRGAPREAPENTVASFRAALDRGANALEVDVCGTRDGRYVLWHDPDPREKITIARELAEGLAYVANEPAIGSEWRRPIEEITYNEFMAHFGYDRRREPAVQLVDGNSPPEVRPEPLEALLDYTASEPRLGDVYLDVKLRDPAKARGLIDALAAAKCAPKLHLLCAEAEVFPALCNDRFPCYADFELPGVLEHAKDLGVRYVSMGCGQRPWGGFRQEVSEVIEARERGELESVLVWTINEEERLRALIELGVDGIVTDDAELLRRVLDPGSRRSA